MKRAIFRLGIIFETKPKGAEQKCHKTFKAFYLWFPLFSSLVRLAGKNMKPDKAFKLSHRMSWPKRKRKKKEELLQKNLSRHDAIFVVARQISFI